MARIGLGLRGVRSAAFAAAALLAGGCLPGEGEFEFFQETAPVGLDRLNEGMFIITKQITALEEKKADQGLTADEAKELRLLKKANASTEAVFAAKRRKARLKAFQKFVALAESAGSDIPEIADIDVAADETFREGLAAALKALDGQPLDVKAGFLAAAARAEKLRKRAEALPESDDRRKRVKLLGDALLASASFAAFACD